MNYNIYINIVNNVIVSNKELILNNILINKIQIYYNNMKRYNYRLEIPNITNTDTKYIHWIWLSKSPNIIKFDNCFYKYMESWIINNPDYLYIIWTDISDDSFYDNSHEIFQKYSIQINRIDKIKETYNNFIKEYKYESYNVENKIIEFKKIMGS